VSLRDLRLRRGWSQEQLAVASGVSVRTIQRLERGQPPSPSTAAALAVALDVDPGAFGEPSSEHTDDAEHADDLGPAPAMTFTEAVRQGVRRWGEFDGRAGRSEFWFFFLAVSVVVGAFAALDERLGAAALVLCLVPLAATGTRRLRDAGQSPWWLLFAVVPMGFVVLLTLMVMPGKAREAVASPQR
jgi:transcriptional regulator with XRE-family HTH domain